MLIIGCDYAEIGGFFQHTERQMIFVGDFIDRVPAAAGGSSNCALHVRRRSSKGRDGKSRIQRDRVVTHNEDGAILRSHSDKNASQHANFLDQIGELFGPSGFRACRARSAAISFI